MDNEYIPVRESHLNYYRAIPLYYENKDNTFGLYKPPGKALSDMRLEVGQYPNKLYIKHTDKLRSIHEVQRQFNQQLESHIKSGDPENIKNILDPCRFPYAEIKLCALQHHEKNDGSGYPRGITRIAPVAEIVGLIDCYEALTNDDRPYRSAMDPLKGLTIIKEDVVAGKFSKDVFEKFAYSLL